MLITFYRSESAAGIQLSSQGLSSVRVVKNCDLVLENAALSLRPRSEFEDLGHSFSLHGPPSRPISYICGPHFRLLFFSAIVFSHDVTAAILVSQNNETAAMLVNQTNPVGVELFSYVKHFLLFQYFCMAAGHVSENDPYERGFSLRD